MILSQYFRKDNPFDYFVLAFIMKAIGSCCGLFISYTIADSFFGIISWILIFKGFSLIPGKTFFPFNSGYKTLLFFYFVQLAVIIFRGYTIDYSYVWISTAGIINYHLFLPTYILCYFMPLATLIPLRYFNFRLVVNYSTLFVFITLIIAIVYQEEIMTASMYAAKDMKREAMDLIKANDLAFYKYFAFVPLFFMYLPRKKWWTNMFGLGLVVLLLIIGARRGSTLLMTILLLLSFYFYTLTKQNGFRQIMQVLICAVLILSAYLLLQSSLTEYFQERGLEDTRSAVEKAMFKQMGTFDWIFGKGLNGRYYCPLNLDDDYLKGWRYGIETGFYNLVLKGGYVFAITYVLLLAIPAFKGVFKSKNFFCKAAGLYIFHSLFALWPFGLLSFDLNFLFIWMFITCCMNDEVRGMTDSEIKESFFYDIR